MWISDRKSMHHNGIYLLIWGWGGGGETDFERHWAVNYTGEIENFYRVSIPRPASMLGCKRHTSSLFIIINHRNWIMGGPVVLYIRNHHILNKFKDTELTSLHKITKPNYHNHVNVSMYRSEKNAHTLCNNRTEHIKQLTKCQIMWRQSIVPKKKALLNLPSSFKLGDQPLLDNIYVAQRP